MVHCLHTMVTVNICMTMKKFSEENNMIDRSASF